MSLARAIELSDEGRFREACATLAAMFEGGGEQAALACAYFVGWSVHVPELGLLRGPLARLARGDARSRHVLDLELATRRGWRGRFDEAATLLEHALPELAAGLPAQRRLRMFGYAAMLQLAAGEVDRAEEHARRAAADAKRADDRRWEAFSNAALALVALERGDVDGAETWLAEAERLAAPVRDVMVPTALALTAGEIAMCREDFEGAVHAYARAVGRSDGRHRFMAPWAWSSLAAAQAERGGAEARGAIAKARQGVRDLGPVLRDAVELRAHHVALAEEAPRARAAIEAALRDTSGHASLRRWRATLAASARRRSTVLRVGAGRRWIEVDGGPRVLLHRSPMQRRLIEVLLARRRAGEGPAVAKALLEDLGIAADTAIELDRAVARVHAATVRLRRAGLGEQLVHGGDGLALHARVFVDEGEA